MEIINEINHYLPSGDSRLNKSMNPKELIEPIDEFWKQEMLESLFGDEQICNLRVDNAMEENEVEYELECVLRRVRVKSKWPPKIKPNTITARLSI